jgi:hypothetical protein
MGNVHYLSAKAAEAGWGFPQLRARAVPHPGNHAYF